MEGRTFLWHHVNLAFLSFCGAACFKSWLVWEGKCSVLSLRLGFFAVITISHLKLDSWMVNPCLYEKHE